MKFGVVFGVLCTGLGLFSCNKRTYNATDLNKDGAGAIQIDAMAFNAVSLWRQGDGAGAPVLNYPDKYEAEQGILNSNSLFYIAKGEYWGKDQNGYDNVFIAKPTEEAYVEDNNLIYSPREGRKLVLRFFEPDKDMRTHAEAVKYCKQKGGRLPTSRELFDFCTAKMTPTKNNMYLKNRCFTPTPIDPDAIYRPASRGLGPIWTASIDVGSPSYAWSFFGESGYIGKTLRTDLILTRCVGRNR
jgi:hypothetical protein